MNSAEQKARDLLEQCGIDDVPAGDVIALANYIADAEYRRTVIVPQLESEIERLRKVVIEFGRGLLGPDWTDGIDPVDWVRGQRD